MLNANLLESEQLKTEEKNMALKILHKQNILHNNISNIQNSMIQNISVKNIIPNPNQPRKDFDERSLFGLAQSIKDYGIIQPLSVRLVRGETPTPVYELIAGERRLRAVKLLFWETVPCIIVNADKQASAEIAIIENLQR